MNFRVLTTLKLAFMLLFGESLFVWSNLTVPLAALEITVDCYLKLPELHQPLPLERWD